MNFLTTILAICCYIVTATNVSQLDRKHKDGMDPDHLFPYNKWKELTDNKYIGKLNITHNCSDKILPYELGVAIVRKITLDKNIKTRDEYARHVFNNWGIGNPECNDGILIFVSLDDRIINIRPAKGAEPALTKYRQRKVIGVMKPFLKKKDYFNGLKKGIEKVHEYLELGPLKPLKIPEYTKKIIAALFTSIAIGLSIYYNACYCFPNKKLDDKIKKLLALKRLVKNGHEISAECPICLKEKITLNNCTITKCDHVFCKKCFNKWSKKSNSCPMCRKDLEKITKEKILDEKKVDNMLVDFLSSLVKDELKYIDYKWRRDIFGIWGEEKNDSLVHLLRYQNYDDDSCFKSKSSDSSCEWLSSDNDLSFLDGLFSGGSDDGDGGSWGDW